MTSNDVADIPGNSTAWRDYALHLRGVLDDLGVEVLPCGPGEVQDCGNDFAHHCISYTAAIKAKAEYGLRHLHHGDPAGEHFGEQQYEYWLDTFLAEDSHE